MSRKVIINDKGIKWRDDFVAYVAKQFKIAKDHLTENGGQGKIAKGTRFRMIMDAIASGATLAVIDEKLWKEKEEVGTRVRVFNAGNYLWESVDFVMRGIMSQTGDGIYTPTDIQQLGNLLFNNYANAKHPRVPEPYSGSRYLLFDNGIYDAKERQMVPAEDLDENQNPTQKTVTNDSVTIAVEPTMTLYDANGMLTPLSQMGFTKKHQHYISLDLTAENPVFESTEDGVDWTPEDWLIRTAGWNKEQADYIASVIGVMLVPNHAFNAFIEINGASSGGKTTLMNLVSQIYGRENSSAHLGYTIDDLMGDFPFRGNVNAETNLVHVTETNGTYVKGNTISLINSFANQSMQMKQMGTTSVNLTPPPLLVLEGKGWLLFDSTKTGIARRLLPVDITNAQTQHYKNKEFGKHVFSQPSVINYLMKRAVLAYSDIIQDSPNNFMFNLDVIDQAPSFLQIWHKQATTAGDSTMTQFIARITGDVNGRSVLRDGDVSMDLLYAMYKESASMDNPDANKRGMTSFTESVKVFLSEQYELTLYDQLYTQVDKSKIAINVPVVSEVMQTPNAIKNLDSATAYQRSDWYHIQRRQEGANRD